MGTWRILRWASVDCGRCGGLCGSLDQRTESSRQSAQTILVKLLTNHSRPKQTLVSAFSRVPDIPQSALDAARAFLQTPSYRTSILTTEHLGREELGVTGVPWYRFSVVDLNLPNDAPEEERVLISFELVGAQDAENFARLVGRAMMKGRERMGRKYGK